MKREEFSYPDEVEVNTPNAGNVEIEYIDDTPEEDRGRTPMPRTIVEELEADELDAYDDKIKEKFKQLRKVWHDERRAKEALDRERQEALGFAQKMMTENKRINNVLASGEKEYVATVQNSANLELVAAKKAYKEAYESGDSDGLVDAQDKMQMANLKLVRSHNMQLNTLQTPEDTVQHAYDQLQAPRVAPPDHKAQAWQERNGWFGTDEEMTATVLGLHQKLLREGSEIGSDEYYSTLDKTMRKRYGEYFEGKKTTSRSIVAPASRSTNSNKVRLSPSAVQLAKRLGLTNEQYAQAVIKMEKSNG